MRKYKVKEKKPKKEKKRDLEDRVSEIQLFEYYCQDGCEKFLECDCYNEKEIYSINYENFPNIRKNIRIVLEGLQDLSEGAIQDLRNNIKSARNVDEHLKVLSLNRQFILMHELLIDQVKVKEKTPKTDEEILLKQQKRDQKKLEKEKKQLERKIKKKVCEKCFSEIPCLEKSQN